MNRLIMFLTLLMVWGGSSAADLKIGGCPVNKNWVRENFNPDTMELRKVPVGIEITVASGGCNGVHQVSGTTTEKDIHGNDVYAVSDKTTGKWLVIANCGNGVLPNKDGQVPYFEPTVRQEEVIIQPQRQARQVVPINQYRGNILREKVLGNLAWALPVAWGLSQISVSGSSSSATVSTTGGGTGVTTGGGPVGGSVSTTTVGGPVGSVIFGGGGPAGGLTP